MPAGCEFICKNRSCDCYGQGFNITAPWPMGLIALVLNAPNVKKDPKFREGLIKLKNDGRKYACITYPNISRIPTVAYRVNMWSVKANSIFQFDVALEGQTFEDAFEKSDIPSKCPKTEGELWSFNEITSKGLNCPHCGLFLHQDRWFTNEE